MYGKDGLSHSINTENTSNKHKRSHSTDTKETREHIRDLDVKHTHTEHIAHALFDRTDKIKRGRERERKIDIERNRDT